MYHYCTSVLLIVVVARCEIWVGFPPLFPLLSSVVLEGPQRHLESYIGEILLCVLTETPPHVTYFSDLKMQPRMSDPLITSLRERVVHSRQL